MCRGRLQTEPHLPGAFKSADPRRPAAAGESDIELLPVELPASIRPDVKFPVEHEQF
jgi:hypothetical protein